MTEAANITVNHNGAISSFDLNDQESKESVKRTIGEGGITSVTYTAGDGKRQTISASGLELAEFLDGLEHIGNLPLTEEDVKSLSTNVGGLLTALNNWAKGVPVSSGGAQEDLALANQVDVLLKKTTISDFDIRELMKLLIKAFSQLLNSQRQVTLNTITNITTALKAKVAAMEKSRDENYNAAVANAVGSIVSGTFQIAGGVCTMAGALGHGPSKYLRGKVGREKYASAPIEKKIEMNLKFWEASSQMFQGAGTISNGVAGLVSASHSKEAKTAEIDTAKNDAILELLRKMTDENSSEFKQLLEFINTLLRMMQELQQNASSTEKTIVQA